MNIEYRKMTPEDFDGVLKLNDKVVAYTAPMDKEKLGEIYGQCSVALSAVCDGKMCGFLLALEKGHSYQSPNYRWYCDNFDNFIYIDRVAVNADFRRMGIASGLYSALFCEAAEKGLETACCEVNFKPKNEVSLEFHRRLDFTQCATLDLSPEKTVSLQIRALKAAGKAVPSTGKE